VPDVPFSRFVLDNGLEVVVVEDHRVPLVAVDVWVHVGSGDEQPGKSGFAHLFEHMMFQGAEHIGEDVHFDVLRKLGATSVNGTTNSDRTNFYEVVPSHQLETALWLESDRLGFLLPMLTDKSLANQRDVVRNERRQRYDNVPFGKERFATNAALFPEGHPYRYLTIGRHEDIEHASVDDVRAFWTRWYTPSNATLAIVGDVNVDAARALVNKWFGGLRKAPKPPATTLPAPQLTKDIRVDVDDPFARLGRVRWAWHAPKALDDDDLDLSFLADVLGAPGWGRLQKALVIDNPIAASVSVSQEGQQLSGTFQIAVTLKPGTAVADVERVVDAELAYLITHGPTDVELARSKLGNEASFLWGLEDLLTRAERLQFFGHMKGDLGYTRVYLERLRARTSSTIAAAGQKWLKRPKVVLVTRPAPSSSSSPSATTNAAASPAMNAATTAATNTGTNATSAPATPSPSSTPSTTATGGAR
jgi:predicted Zn-dependent peptidase